MSWIPSGTGLSWPKSRRRTRRTCDSCSSHGLAARRAVALSGFCRGHRALVAGRVGLRKSFRRGDRFEIPSRIGGSPVIAMAHATLPDGHPGTVRSDAVPKKLTQPTLQRYSTKRRTGSSAPVKQGTTRLRSLFTMDHRRSVTSEAVSTGTIIVPSKHVVRRVRARKSAAGAEYPITTSSLALLSASAPSRHWALTRSWL